MKSANHNRRSKLLLALVIAACASSWLMLRREPAVHGMATHMPVAPGATSAVTARVAAAAVAAPSQAADETPEVQTGLPIGGVVVDATGGPIPGARLEALEDVLSDAWRVTGESGADGTFELRVPEGPATLRTTADGYAANRQVIVSPVRGLRIQLSPAARVTGQVVSALDGRPLFGIEVHASSALTLLAAPSDGMSVSDQRGRFAIDGLSAGSYRIIARSRAWFGQTDNDVTVRIGDSTSDIRLSLYPAVSVRGRVLVASDAEPCSGGLAWLRSEVAQRYASSAVIAAHGTVEFNGVPEGTYRVEVQCQDGFAAGELPAIRVGASDLDLVWTLQAGGRVVGRVLDRLGRGLARAIEAAGVSDQDANRMPPRSARSNEHGDFELRGLGAGRYRIALTHAPDVHHDLDVMPGAEATRVTLQVQHGASLRVQLTGADPVALDGFTVSALQGSASQQDGTEQYVHTAQRVGPGLFVIGDLPEGSCELSADDGHNPALARNVSLLADQEVRLSWPLPLRDGRLEGRVLDARGEPVSDAWVRITNGVAFAGVASAHAVLTQIDGRFALEHLDRFATYDVEAHRPPGARALLRSIKPGQLAVLTLPTESD